MAHLCLGDALITVLPVQDSPFDQYLKQPDEIGGSETQTSYIVLRDVQAHYHRAKAAGAEIILELTRDDQGGRGYSCRDCEGHIWSFGTYDPRQENPDILKWFGSTTTPDQKSDRTRVARTAVPVTLVVGLIAGWVLGQYGVHNVVELVQTTSVVSRETPEHSPATPIVVEAPSSATLDISSADPRSSYLAEQLLKEFGAKEEAIRLARQADDRAALESRAKENAVRTLSLLQSDLASERHQRDRAERAAKDTLEQLSRERRARKEAETLAKEAQRKLASSAVERTPEDPTSLPPATTAKIHPASGPPVAENEITP